MKKIIKHYPMTDRLIVRRGYHTVGTVPAFNRKIVEICKFDIPNTHINDPSWLSSGTSIKSDWVKLVYSRFF
jgi:hypothetical protein